MLGSRVPEKKNRVTLSRLWCYAGIRQVLPGPQSRRCPEAQRRGQPLQSEARNAKNAPESAICRVLPNRLAPTGSRTWRVPISIPRSAPRQKGILVFLARDASQRVLCYANAGLTKAQQPNEVLEFVAFWQRRTGHPPAELVFDSHLTTYAHLHQLNQQGIRFMTLRRRSKKMLGEIYSRPASAWRRITLPALSRTFRTPRVLDERIALKDYADPIRQLTVTDLGHEEPTVLLTNHLERSCPDLVTRYAQRMLIENGISEAIQFFHLDALSSMVGLKVDFDLQITLMASSLYRLMAAKIGREYERAQAKKIFRNLLDVSATVTITHEQVVVRLDKRAHNPFLVASSLAQNPIPMPWFGNKQLVITFA